MTTTPDRPAGSRALASLTLPLGGMVLITLAGALIRHGLDLARGLSPATQIDTIVTLVVTLGGALLAAWAALHVTIASACLLGAACGRRWRVGERLVVQHGPVLVRRALAAALGVSLGVSGLAAASAATPVIAHSGTTTAPVALQLELPGSTHPGSHHEANDEVPVDLGWTPTPDIIPISDTDHTDTDTDDVDGSDSSDAATGDEETGDEETGDTETGDEGTGHEDPDAPDSDDEVATDPVDGTDTAPGTDVDEDETSAPRGDESGRDGTDRDGASDNDSPADSTDTADKDEDEDTSAPDKDSAPRGTQRYVVAPGDSLWSITDHFLKGASDDEIAAAWPELYEANRSVVGSDPDRIRPGQELVLPTVLEELT